MRVLRLLLLSLCSLLLTTAATNAADTSWQVDEGIKYSSVSGGGAVVTAWIDRKSCKAGQFKTRSRTSSGWSSIVSVPKKCTDVNKSAPQMTRDSRSGKTYLFWSQSSILDASVSGLYYTVSTNKGRSWSKPHFLIPTPKAQTEFNFAAAVYGGKIWVMYHKPSKDVSARRKPFLLEPYSASSDRKLRGNIAVQKGVFNADVTNDNNAMKISASSGGLVLYWEITDVGGLPRDFTATTSSPSSSKLIFNGAVDTADFTRRTYFVGENGLPYLALEKTKDIIRTTEVWKWNSSSKRFSATGIHVEAYLDRGENAVTPTSTVTVQGDTQGNTYLMYLNFNDISDPSGKDVCFTLRWGCSRSIAPNATPSPLYIIKRTAAGTQTRTQVAMPFSAGQQPGSNMVEWIENRSGLETVTGQFGGLHALWRSGWENVTTSGSLGINERYNVVVSDPLTFS
jgi:hypothetical protein